MQNSLEQFQRMPLFVVLNCADYANNKNYYRLSYLDTKKERLQGPIKDTKGLIEEADKGYLFLDEVHRLSPEGQEKVISIYG